MYCKSVVTNFAFCILSYIGQINETFGTVFFSILKPYKAYLFVLFSQFTNMLQ